MRDKTNKRIFILILFIAIIFLFLWLTGVIGIWTGGISNIENNTKEFVENGHVVEEEYSISIDLSNMESNIGKDLYNDGNHRIYVAWIDNTGSVNSGGYRIGFRSSGNYSLTNATLISGVHHITINESSFTTEMSAEMTAKYNGKVYNSSELGSSGLNYRDGDDFSFYLFPPTAYEKGEISLDEKGLVELTVKDLYKNIWSKK